MPHGTRRFRIEITGDGQVSRPQVASRATSRAPETAPVRHAAAEPDADTSPRANPEIADLSAALGAMRHAIATTKREVSDLERSPSGATGVHRAACELDAVSLATEQATTTILGAVEEIEMAAQLVRNAGVDLGRNDPAGIILERVMVLYEACNFQDVAGQRIRKVVNTLQYVEARLDALIAVWGDKPGPAIGPDQSYGAALLAGPALPGEIGHVSQSDVDAFFA